MVFLFRKLSLVPNSVCESWRYCQLLSTRFGSFYPINDAFFGLSEEQQQLRKTIFNFAQKEIAPKAAQIDREDRIPDMKDLWQKMGAMGLLGATVDPKYGGSGMGYLDHTIVCEEIARASGSFHLMATVKLAEAIILKPSSK